jgi:hypothetical protein
MRMRIRKVRAARIGRAKEEFVKKLREVNIEVE